MLEVGKTYDFELIGYSVIHRNSYELKYLDGTKPYAYAEDENNEKYLICVEYLKHKYSLFKDIDDDML